MYKPINKMKYFQVDSSNTNNDSSFFDITEAIIMSAPVIFSDAEHYETQTLNIQNIRCIELLSPVEVAATTDYNNLIPIDAEQLDTENVNNESFINSGPILGLNTENVNNESFINSEPILDESPIHADPSEKDTDYIPEPDSESGSESDDNLKQENTNTEIMTDYIPEQDSESGSESDNTLKQVNTNTEIITIDNAETERQKTRKRKRSEENWPRSIRKRKRNLGQSYLSAKKKHVPDRSLQVPCTDKCKQKCITKISDTSRVEILTSFWKSGDLTQQRQFICNHTEDIKPKYRYIKENSQRKNNTQAYYFHVNNEKNSSVQKILHEHFKHWRYYDSYSIKKK